jgi:deoxyribodipyrimidine photolyase-related protein
MDQHLKEFVSSISIPHGVFDTEHFFCARGELKEMFAKNKSYVMESFYRKMRKKHDVLVDGEGNPFKGQWNFDEDNRQKLPKDHKIIKPHLFSNNLKNIENEIVASGVKTIGTVDSNHFIWPINRKQSVELLHFFTDNCLQYFGSFQDAMTQNEWSIYHSRLSFSLNVKMLSPKEVIDKAIDSYNKNPDSIAYHQLEGFVRQILGWREYMRGVYWAEMPDYAKLNYFSHELHLPEWFWTGNTKMNCLKHAIDQSLEYAYAHHIQRLMITGNFLLLAGIHPDEVDEWYLGIYIDALEWVEITNTRGMSQFADGGIVGTKPYVSSSAYINKMSNYCSGCHYDHKQKTGDCACPFNSLYWHFYNTHQSLLAKNPRIGMVYNTWKKMNADVKKELIDQAEYYLKNINEL